MTDTTNTPTTPVRPPVPIYRQLATAVEARQNCIKANNLEWRDRHEQTIRAIMLTAPHGSGIDGTNSIDLDRSTPDKLIMYTEYHHMNDVGMYDGWTDHTITVRPSLAHKINLTIGGRDRNDVKEYLYQCFEYWLTEPADEVRV